MQASNGYNQYEQLPDYGEMPDEPPMSLRLIREHRSATVGNHVIPIMSPESWSKHENRINRLMPINHDRYLIHRYYSVNNIVNDYILTRTPTEWTYHVVAYMEGEETPYNYYHDESN